MGWTYCYKPPELSVSDFLRRQFDAADGYSVVTDSTTATAYFAIIERTDAQSPMPERFCLVCLLRHADSPQYNFGWKDISEEMGPYVIPPQAFFRALQAMIPEPAGELGREWRNRCRTHYRNNEPGAAHTSSATWTFRRCTRDGGNIEILRGKAVVALIPLDDLDNLFLAEALALAQSIVDHENTRSPSKRS